MSLSETSKEIAFLYKLIVGLAYPLKMPFTIYEDNESARMLASHDVHHNRTKHIDIRHHVRRQEVAYLQGQAYLEPHPCELMLLNHV